MYLFSLFSDILLLSSRAPCVDVVCVHLPLDRCNVLSLIVCKARSKFHLSIAKALLGLNSDITLLVKGNMIDFATTLIS